NKQESIKSSERNFFNRNGQITGPSATTFPGTYTAKTNQLVDPTDPSLGYQSVTYTPFAAPDCPRDQHLYPRNPPTQCGEVTSDFVNYTPSAERISGFMKGAFKLTENHTASLEAFMSQNRTWSQIAPVPYGGLSISAASPYYPGAGITPLPPG